MGKREMDDFEREAMALGIQSMREPPVTQYTTPGEGQKWRARDLLDIHWNLAGIACPVSFNRILSCIIGHANPTTGRCDPKQKLIATETGYSRDTVIRAVKWAEAEGFLKSEARGLGRSKAYHPQWALFEMFWVAIAEDIETQKAASRGRDGISPCSNKGQHACSNKGQHDVLQHAATHESQSRTSKDESHPERVPSDEVTLVGGKKENEKGNQGEPVESLSTNPQPRAEPNVYTLINLNADKLESAAAAVDTDLSRHPLYAALLGWPELEAHLPEAASAELRERGSGAKLVLARFAERRATGT